MCPAGEGELRVRKAEWKRRGEEIKSVGGLEKVPQEYRSALQPSLGVMAAPPRLPPFDPANAAIEPGFRPITEERNSHFTDPAAGTCSCPGFLNSRFLLCRHLVLRMTFAVATASPLTSIDEDRLWFDVVARNRSPPFWTVPAEVHNRADAVQVGEVAPAEPWNVFESYMNGESGDQDFADDFGGGRSSGSSSGASSSGGADSEDDGDDDLRRQFGDADRGESGRNAGTEAEVGEDGDARRQPARRETPGQYRVAELSSRISIC